MFYSLELLGRRGPLGILWLAATLKGSAAFSRHVGAALLAQQNCVSLCETILQSPVPLSLRLRGVLLAGVVYIHSMQVAALERSAAATRDRLMSLKQSMAGSNVALQAHGIDLTELNEAPSNITLPHISLTLDVPSAMSQYYLNHLVQDSDQFTQILPLIHLRPPVVSFPNRFQSDSSESYAHSSVRNFRSGEMPLLIDAAVREAGDGAFMQDDWDNDRMDDNASFPDQDSANSISLRRDKYADVLALEDAPDPVGELFPANDHFEDWNPGPSDDIPLPPAEIDIPSTSPAGSTYAVEQFVPLVAASRPTAKSAKSSSMHDDIETEIPDQEFVDWLRDTTHSTRSGPSVRRASIEQNIVRARKGAHVDWILHQLVGTAGTQPEFRALSNLIDMATVKPGMAPSDPPDDVIHLDFQTTTEVALGDTHDNLEAAFTPLVPSAVELPESKEDSVAPLGLGNDPPGQMLSIIRQMKAATSGSPTLPASVDMEDPEPAVEQKSSQESSKSSSLGVGIDHSDRTSSLPYQDQSTEPNMLTFASLVYHTLPRATLTPRQLAARMFYNVLLLVKQHKVHLLQETPYGPIYVQSLV